jgi:arylsulfatase
LAFRTIDHRIVQTFKEFPPRQKAASFTVDQAMEKLKPQAH